MMEISCSWFAATKHQCYRMPQYLCCCQLVQGTDAAATFSAAVTHRASLWSRANPVLVLPKSGRKRRTVRSIPADQVFRASQKRTKGLHYSAVLGSCIRAAVNDKETSKDSTCKDAGACRTERPAKISINSFPAAMSQFAGSQTSGPTIRQPTNHKLSSFAVFTVTLSAALVLSFPNPTQALLVTSDATETRALARLVQAASVAWQRGPQSQTWKGGEDARATKPPLGPNPPQLVEIETFKKQPNGNVSFEPISERALEEESEAEGGKVSAAKLSATPNEVKGTGLVGVLVSIFQTVLLST